MDASSTPTNASNPEPVAPVGLGSSSSSRRNPRTFRCRYCSHTFNRLEHIQRHERTHTKEKPFPCACGKAFARRDLLLRHEKLVHDIESSRITKRSAPTANEAVATPVTPQTLVEVNIQTGWAAQPLATLNPHDTNQYIPAEGTESRQQATFFPSQVNPQQPENISTFGGNPDYGRTEIPGDYNLFFDNFDISNFFLPATVFESELPISLWSRPDHGGEVEPENISRNVVPSGNDNDALGRFGSRLPSLQLEEQSLMDSQPSPQADILRAGPPWKISGQDHRAIQLKLKDFASVLPEGFILPSRYTLSRYFEGYISGFHQHLPFLHIPTFSVSKLVPELVLAIAAVGAQYRFETTQGNKIWYAAKSVATEQIRIRQSQQVADILTSPTPRPASLSRSPMSHSELQTPKSVNLSNRYAAEDVDISENIRLVSTQARLGTLQTLLVLMAMGMWGPTALLREAMIIQNQLALLIRDDGLHTFDVPNHELRWEDWILIEGDCRTKCIAYCFFNLHSIAYDTPPVLRTSEMKTNLPQSAELWRAESAEEWQIMQRNAPRNPLSFHHELSRLFSTEHKDLQQISSLGNYALIHAIIQQIYVVRQASAMACPNTRDGSLPREDIERFGQVLKLWQIGWEKAPESSLDPTNPYGPVAFSSTALLRLAYSRLHCDLGPCRRLDTRDPQIIARTLISSPPLSRSPLLSHAILQAAHALSIPVKIGLKYVAHTHTLLWSMQHSLGNLECAFLLSKWLHKIADFMTDLTVDEQNLLDMVRSIVSETHLAALSENNTSGVYGPAEVRKLSIAVVRLWAEVFTGSHHVFPLVRVIGLALESYADMCDADESQI